MFGTSINECPRFAPDELHRVRKERRLSRRALGELINRNGQNITRWENGTTSPSARALREVAHVLRVRPENLLHPIVGAPTLADLRMNRALTVAELAALCAFTVERIWCWEVTGHLGTPDEQPLLLSAYLGISRESIERYQLTAAVPEAITFRLARVLHVRRCEVQAAFERTAELYASAKGEQRTAS